MAESKSDPTQSLSDNKDVKAPNIFERAKEEIEAVLHTGKTHQHHKESHGMRDDIDETTPLDDVKAPNVFQRAKEEIEALVQAIHQKKESQTHEARDQSTEAELNSKKAENNVNAKEEIEAIMHHEKSPHRHHKETHGSNDDIDESTPIDEIKGPNVFERAKEEIEALVETIHPQKESSNSVSSPKKKGGFMSSVGRGLEKLCSPWGNTKD